VLEVRPVLLLTLSLIPFDRSQCFADAGFIVFHLDNFFFYLRLKVFFVVLQGVQFAFEERLFVLAFVFFDQRLTVVNFLFKYRNAG
jgi:hypothetical protein